MNQQATVKRRQSPDDYWKEPSFARKYVLNNVKGVHDNPGAREFSASTFASFVQGIQYLKMDAASVLDAGCGHAARTASLRASLGCRVVGVDYSEAMLEEAGRVMQFLPEAHRPELVQGDVYKLPFEDNEFDVAVCYGLLMSLEKPAQADLMRVVRYGLVAIEETETAMTPEQREAWVDVKTRIFPGRIYWHDYLKVFGHFRQVIYNPMPVPESWNLGTPPGYARFIVVKEPSGA